MSASLLSPELAGPFAALVQVLLIDVALAGDNAVAVGLVAAGLPPEQKKRAILWGLVGSVILRILFALLAVQLLKIPGLLLLGGLMLLYVCWKIAGDLRSDAGHEAGLKPAKTFAAALTSILIADVSMSLDNVLAVAGAAREHPVVLVFGLLLSIVLMGLAATWIAKLLERHRWIGWVGVLIVFYVSLHMIWEGHRELFVSIRQTAAYNRVVPAFMTIDPVEIARLQRHG